MFIQDTGKKPKLGYMNPDDAREVIEELGDSMFGMAGGCDPYTGLQIYGIDFVKIPTLPRGSVAFRHP